MSEVCEQRYEFDCFLACVAAAVDGNYADLWESTVEYKGPPHPNIGAHNFVQRTMDRRGIYGEDIPLVFERAGLLPNRDYWQMQVPLAAIDCARSMLWGRRAIIQVPSLNNERATHIVYWDGAQVHDPSKKQKYHWLQAMLIQNVWLLKDKTP